jgi:hypothetical protein
MRNSDLASALRIRSRRFSVGRRSAAVLFLLVRDCNIERENRGGNRDCDTYSYSTANFMVLRNGRHPTSGTPRVTGLANVACKSTSATLVTSTIDFSHSTRFVHTVEVKNDDVAVTTRSPAIATFRASTQLAHAGGLAPGHKVTSLK